MGGPTAETGAGNEAPAGQSEQQEPLNNRDIQDGFLHHDPAIPVRPEHSEAKSKDALMPPVPIVQRFQQMSKDRESNEIDATDGSQHEAPPDPNPLTPPEGTPEKPESPSTQPDDAHHWGALHGDNDVSNSSGSDSTAVSAKPRRKTKASRGDTPDKSSSTPGRKTKDRLSNPKRPRDIGGRRNGSPGVSKPHPQPAFRPELICRKRGLEWEVVLSGNDEYQAVEVWHNGAPEDMKQDEYQLHSLAGSLSVAYNDKQIKFVLCDHKPLIFKLGANWKAPGRKVDNITNGYFVVIAPSDWTRTGHVSVAPDRCTDSGFLAHYFHRAKDEPPSDVGGFEESPLPLIRPQASLVGQAIFDDSDEGELFGGKGPPRLALDRGIVWVRIGEEIPEGWDGRNFILDDDQALAEALAGRQGRFFLRVYDDETKLLDSCQFRYLRNLKEIRVNGEPYTQHTIIAPSSTEGHRPTRVSFVGIDGTVFSPILRTEVPHARTEGDCLVVDPHPSGDVVSCALKSETGHVNMILHLPRIWWRMVCDMSKLDEWHGTAIRMTRQEFQEYADMDAAMLLRLPRRTKSVGVGFDKELERQYRPEARDGDAFVLLALPLRDFVDYSQIDQRLIEDALFNIEYESATLTLIRVSRDPVPTITSFVCSPATVFAGEHATLHWTTRDTEVGGVEIDPDVGTVESSGSLEITPLKTMTYTLRLTASGLDDITKAVLVTVGSPPGMDQKPIARVKSADGDWKYGKGFSYGEIRAAGLTSADAMHLSLTIDKRRRTIHPANIDMIRRPKDV